MGDCPSVDSLLFFMGWGFKFGFIGLTEESGMG